MTPHQLDIITIVAAVGSGLMGGLLFAFSAAVMRSLGRIPAEHGIVAMQSINKLILNPAFGLVFFATAGSCGALLFERFIRHGAVSDVRVAGAATYLIGFLVITATVHVPLNNSLDRLDPRAPSSTGTWRRYQTRWTALNHVRVLAAATACALLTSAV